MFSFFLSFCLLEPRMYRHAHINFHLFPCPVYVPVLISFFKIVKSGQHQIRDLVHLAHAVDLAGDIRHVECGPGTLRAEEFAYVRVCDIISR
jgi:hypothetical protein